MKQISELKPAALWISRRIAVKVLFSIFSVWISASALPGRDETSKYMRNNPTDRLSPLFQGVDSIDADGDGLGDFTVKIHDGSGRTTDRIVRWQFSGPRYAKVFISDNVGFRPAWEFGFTNNLPFLIGNAPSKQWYYVKFQYMGGGFSKIYSNSIQFEDTIDENAWLTSPIYFAMSNVGEFTTNTLVLITFLTPPKTIQCRVGTESNSSNSWSPLMTNVQTKLSANDGNITTNTIYLDLKFVSGATRQIKTNLVFVPWASNGIENDGSSGFVTNALVSIGISNYRSYTHIRFSTNLTEGEIESPWTPSTSQVYVWLGSNSSEKFVFFQGMNSNFSLRTPIMSNRILPEPIKVRGMSWTGSPDDRVHRQQTLILDVQNANFSRFSTIAEQMVNSPWVAYSNILQWSWPSDGTTNQRNLYVSFSNAIWGFVSTNFSVTFEPLSIRHASFSFSNGALISTTNFAVYLNASNADFYRSGSSISEVENSTWSPMSNFFSSYFQKNGTTNDRVLLIQLSNVVWENSLILSNSISVCSFRDPGFSNIYSNVSAPTTNLVFYLTGSNFDYFCFSTNRDFSENPPWQPYTPQFQYSFRASVKSSNYLLYLKVSNSVWGNVSETLSNVIQAVQISNYTASFSNHLSLTSNSSISLVLNAPEAHFYRVSSNGNFSSGTGWSPIGGAQEWGIYSTDRFLTNTVYIQFSDSIWGTLSSIVTNKVITKSTLLSTNKTGLSFTHLPGGKFLQGETTMEIPLRTNRLSPFAIQTHEMTWRQWTEVYSWAVTNGFSFSSAGTSGAFNDDDPDMPVTGITLFDAMVFANALSRKEGRTEVYYFPDVSTPVVSSVSYGPYLINWNADGYRLPTECEWEFACRGGETNSTFWIGSNSMNYAYYNANSIGASHVGLKLPNPFGLFDMSGNVYEYTQDAWVEVLPTTNAVNPWEQPVDYEFSTSYVLRGGGWMDTEEHLMSGARSAVLWSDTSSQFGFRLVTRQP